MPAIHHQKFACKYCDTNGLEWNSSKGRWNNHCKESCSIQSIAKGKKIQGPTYIGSVAARTCAVSNCTLAPHIGSPACSKKHYKLLESGGGKVTQAARCAFPGCLEKPYQGSNTCSFNHKTLLSQKVTAPIDYTPTPQEVFAIVGAKLKGNNVLGYCPKQPLRFYKADSTFNSQPLKHSHILHFLGNFYPVSTPMKTTWKDANGDTMYFANSEAAFQYGKFKDVASFKALPKNIKLNIQSLFQRIDGQKAWELLNPTNPPQDKHYMSFQLDQSNVAKVCFDKIALQAAKVDKDQLMKEVIGFKFATGTQEAKLLLATCSANLQEASDRDSYWGIGSDEKGANTLGKFLEAQRAFLAKDVATVASVVSELKDAESVKTTKPQNIDSSKKHTPTQVKKPSMFKRALNTIKGFFNSIIKALTSVWNAFIGLFGFGKKSSKAAS